MKISPSILSDEHKFRAFWIAAILYQKSKRLPLWPAYPEEKIRDEIVAGLHFSAFMPDGTLAGYFSLALSDALIWEQREKGDAVYIHRMCVNPGCKGNNLAAAVLIWANDYGDSRKLRYIRMDTWGDNQGLVRYYVTCGFRHIGNRQTGLVPELPAHYQNASLALFENEI